MRTRLNEFLKVENKSSAQLAEEIGVQPSGISHILSGRNNPSLDFVLKMLEKYQFLSTDWLLFGKGSMYKDVKMQNLFDEITDVKKVIDIKPPDSTVRNLEIDFREVKNDDASLKNKLITSEVKNNTVERIVWFFNDKSFVEYLPNR